MKRKNSFYQPFLWLISAALLFPAACSDSPDLPSGTPAPSTARKPDHEWFWRDRLCLLPESPVAKPCPPGLAEKLHQAMKGLMDKPPLAADEVVDRLAVEGEVLVQPLAEYLRSEHRAQQWAAVALLGRMRGHAPLPGLLDLLRDEWDAPAILAAACLMKSETPWILPRMLKTLGPYPVDFNPHLMVRVKVAAGLHRFGNYSGVPFLIKILKDNTPASDPEREWDQDPRLAWEKEEALMAMESLMGQTSGFLIDAPLAEQARAALALEAWWLSRRVDLWQKAPPLDDPLLCTKVRALVAGLGSFQARNADGARYCLKLLGPPVFPFLDEAIRKGEFYERFHALDILAHLAPLAGDAAPAWARTAAFALGDKSPAVRAQAAHTLGCLHQAESLGPLEKALIDPDLDVRLSAVCALGHLSTEEAREILQTLLDQDIPGQMAVEAKAALFHASPKFLDLFIQEFLDPDARRQEWALQKLIDLTGEDGGFPVGAAPLEREQALPAVRILLQCMKR